MTKSDRAVLKAAIDKYGNDSQLAVAQEECAELIQAISKLNRAGSSDHCRCPDHAGPDPHHVPIQGIRHDQSAEDCKTGKESEKMSYDYHDYNLFDAAVEAKQKQDKESVKITSLELENVKRVKAVKIEPTENGLTVIGGKNNQGKTSILDAITWALGGDKYKPSQPKREGSMVDPHIHIQLSNGILVERSGKNSTLKVTDTTGKKAGQKLLDSFISSFALDLPKFINSSAKDKASTLLQIIGVDDQLTAFDNKESAAYNRRTEIGRIADQKKKYADEMPQWDGVPEEIVSASELIQKQQDILARNGENQRQRNNLEDLNDKIAEGSKTVEQLKDESTAELEQNIADVDAINAKVRDNLNKQKAEEEASEYQRQYDALTKEIETVREDRTKLLDNAKMPLPGLSVDHGELTYKGQKWDNMSGSEQMIVATAIVRELNPKCGFVLLDKLEQMDVDTMNEFGKWLQKEGLQAIATRVSTGDECSIYIEDGYSIKNGVKTAATEVKPAELIKTPEPSEKPTHASQKWDWKGK